MNFDWLFKTTALALASCYLIYSIVLRQRVQSMSRTIITPDSKIFKSLATANLIAAAVIGLLLIIA